MNFFLAGKLKSCTIFFLGLCFLFFSTGALADNASPTSDAGAFMGLKVGTLGFGADMGYGFNNLFKARLNMNFFSIDQDWDDDDDDDVPSLSSNATIESLSAGLLLDLHPFRKGFRLTGGIYHSDLQFKLEEDYGSWKEFASAEFNGVAPYVGIGYGNTNESGLSFNFDIGAMFLGSPEVHYSDPTMNQAEIEEEIKDIEDDIENIISIYPVIMFGITYRF